MGRAPRPQAPTADLLGLRQPAPPSAIHDRKLRTVRDLACFGRRTYLRIEIVRVACPVCGVRVERLGFLHSNPRHSRRFAYQVARLCLAMPVSSAAAVAAISWDAARGLLESVSAAALKPLEPPEDLRWIGVDEKSWRRGRRFCTVVSELESGRVIWLAPGHSGEALAEFFAWLGERSERIEAAAIDLSHSYEETIRRHCPGVAIVYDRYQVAKLLLEALNDARRRAVLRSRAKVTRPLPPSDLLGHRCRRARRLPLRRMGIPSPVRRKASVRGRRLGSAGGRRADSHRPVRPRMAAALRR